MRERLTGLEVVLVLIALTVMGGATASAQTPSRELQRELRQSTERLAEAQRAGDEPQVRKLAADMVKSLGDLVGVPETPDEFRQVPKDVPALAPSEIPAAYEKYLAYIERAKWWRVGLDPTKNEHLPREVASVILGCLGARRAGCNDGDKLLATAVDAGDYLVWTQQQGGTGVIPFPAVRNASGRVFEVAERAMRRAEQQDKLDDMIRHGWVVDDLGRGDLQFDNGLCGVALLELYQATKDERHLQSARAAADWAVGRAAVPNWNYNSFSVYLLAKVFRVTGDVKYLDAAKQKAWLGVYPGQLREGKFRGRWADPHNARIPYHYIMIRGIADLMSVLDAKDPDRPAAIDCLKLALQARNPDFVTRGVANPDAAFEALLLVSSLPPAVRTELGDCGTSAALAELERYACAGIRAGRPSLSPGTWGLYLQWKASQNSNPP